MGGLEACDQRRCVKELGGLDVSARGAARYWHRTRSGWSSRDGFGARAELLGSLELPCGSDAVGVES